MAVRVGGEWAERVMGSSGRSRPAGGPDLWAGLLCANGPAQCDSLSPTFSCLYMFGTEYTVVFSDFLFSEKKEERKGGFRRSSCL